MFRETNDEERDTETIHTIKKVFYKGSSDIAILELQNSVNQCSHLDVRREKCWPISPVQLPPADLEIRENQTARALGRNILMKTSPVIQYQGWGLFEFQVQSDVLRQIDLNIHSYEEKPGLIETDVGPRGEDVCAGDSGESC